MCKTTLEDKTVLNISDGKSLLSWLSVAYFTRHTSLFYGAGNVNNYVECDLSK